MGKTVETFEVKVRQNWDLITDQVLRHNLANPLYQDGQIYGLMFDLVPQSELAVVFNDARAMVVIVEGNSGGRLIADSLQDPLNGRAQDALWRLLDATRASITIEILWND